MAGSSPAMTNLFLSRSYRHSFAISPRIRASFSLNMPPSEIRGRRECRALDAPAASHATKKAHEHSHHGHAGITRAFPAQWFTAYSVLSPVTGLFCHCRLRIAPQTWRQRRGVRTTRLCRPPQRRSSRALPASTASRLTSVTIAKRLLRGDATELQYS